MELEFMELEFHKKRHYRAPFGTIRLKKKNFILKRQYRALKHHYRAPYGVIRFKKKTCMF